LKSGAARRDIPLGDEIAAQLIAYRRDNSQGPRTPVFASSTGTELIRGKVAERVLSPASIAAGLKIEERVVGKNGKERIKVRPTGHLPHVPAHLRLAPLR
jgi:hypothetical protein